MGDKLPALVCARTQKGLKQTWLVVLSFGVCLFVFVVVLLYSSANAKGQVEMLSQSAMHIEKLKLYPLRG